MLKTIMSSGSSAQAELEQANKTAKKRFLPRTLAMGIHSKDQIGGGLSRRSLKALS
jgi:hypothetical protein